jgi:hypothetical protein
MKRPTRNLLYAVLAFVCVALLLPGIGLDLPKALGVLTAAEVGTSSSPSAEASTPAQSQAAPAGAAVPSTGLTGNACTESSSIETSFNSTPIAEGSTIWFYSAIRVDRVDADATRISLNDSRITFAANGSKYNLAVPAATITFDPAATAATTSYLSEIGRWATMVPGGHSGRVFLSGLAFPVPAGGLPGGISSVTWSAAFSTDTHGVTAEWQWGAAVYSTFPTDYNAIEVKAAEDQPSEGAGMLTVKTDELDSVGRPAGLEAFVMSVAGGEGGSNLTGSFRVASNVMPCAVGTFAQPRTTSHMTIAMANRGGVGTLDVTTGLAMTRICTNTQPPDTMFECFYIIVNMDPTNTVTNLAVTNEVPFPGGSPVAVPCVHTGVGVVTTLQPFGTPGAGCMSTIAETSPPCSPSGSTLFTNQVTATGIDTNSGGIPFPVSVSTTDGVEIPACTPTPTLTPTWTPTYTPTVTPTPGNQGCGPGFWKQGQHFKFWGCGNAPNMLVSSAGLLTTACGCNFSSLTMLQALNGSSGNTVCDAQAKLYQMAAAALLNACSTVEYPLMRTQIVSEVNAALGSCSRDTILNEASRISGFNNGPGGCPLGGPGPYNTPSNTPTITPTWTLTNTPTLTPTWTPTNTATRPECRPDLLVAGCRSAAISTPTH